MSPVTGKLFDPVISRARLKLYDRLDSARHGKVSPALHAGWEAHLIERLDVVSAKAVEWQFQIFQTAHAAFAAPDARGQDREAELADFVGRPEKRLRQLYAEFPLLEHLCETLVCHWVEVVEDFLASLWADRGMFTAWFGETFAGQTAVAVEAGLSDSHCGGRTVVRVHFDHGATVIYKPRSLTPEIHFTDLLDFVNGRECPRPLISAKSVDRNEYGWMQDVIARPCKSPTEVESFYWRAGVLLGLVFLTGGVDMHRENLIAAGEYPVLIDLETLVHLQNVAGMENHPSSHSLLRTGFLPMEAGTGSRYTQMSALSRGVQLDRDNGRLPHIPGQKRHFTATSFTASILAGFDWIGDALLLDRAVALQFADRLRALGDCPQRRVLRSTDAYSRILGELTSLRCLRQREFPVSAVEQISRDTRVTLNEEEIRSLSLLDIPYLMQVPTTGDVHSQLFNRPSHSAFRAERRIIIEALSNR